MRENRERKRPVKEEYGLIFDGSPTVPATAKQVTPMLCIPKKNGTLRTVFDLRQQNENTWKDVTPFPDQDTIHHDIARAKFRSKLDMTEAYVQMHIRPEDVGKTTFSTIFGAFQS